MPLYFILLAYSELAGLLSKQDFLFAFFLVLLGIIVAVYVAWFFIRNFSKAALMVTFTAGWFLFFGDIRETFANLPLLKYVSSYKIFLPLSAVVLFFVNYKIVKARSGNIGHLFLNVLLVIYLVIGIIGLRETNRKLNYSTADIDFNNNKPATLPGIYYIVLDGYPSSELLRNEVGMPSNPLDSALAARNFYVAKNPSSNYSYTSFSIASTFNMDYLPWLDGITQAKPNLYSKGATAVSTSLLPSKMKELGYTTYNLSIFDLPGEPAISKDRLFFPIRRSYIFHNIFYNKLKWEIIPFLFPKFIKKLSKHQQDFNRSAIEGFRDHNKRTLDSMFRLPASEKTRSKFVYAHFEMPHYPYFFDANGTPYPDNDLYFGDFATDKNRLAGYITYINNNMLRIVDSINKYSGGQDIIIIQSDHGSREIFRDNKDMTSNYSAFYFPDRDYRTLYDSISNVNTFRVVFNKYFNQRLPLLADSVHYTN